MLQRPERAAHRRADEVSTTCGAPSRPTTTCRPAGRGRSTRRSTGSSRTRPGSAASTRTWSCRGRRASRTRGALREQFRSRHRRRADDPRSGEASCATSKSTASSRAPIEGTSFLYTFDAKNAKAPTHHTTQYFEMMGQYALYHDGWMLGTKVNRAPWEAFGPAESGPAQQPDVPALQPQQRLQPDRRHRGRESAEGQGNAGEVHRRRRRKYQVFPMDASVVGTDRHAAPEHHRRAHRVHYTRPMIGRRKAIRRCC